MAWYCTVDRVTDAEDHKNGLPTRVGWRSKDWDGYNLPPDVNRAAKDHNVRLWLWRCKDADGNTYYEGVSTVDPNQGDGEDVFAPLDDFAMPDAGAVAIQYWLKGQWETI